ncbi:MAG: bifunctional metallophosphatase/5'-nucleotidase [Synechococcaceae bacterium WB5_2A_257]|nr:bifunctional metallophosphatase/5'-nucleotidase [Synechococcaceae bacterium WB5_2A_257]
MAAADYTLQILHYYGESGLLGVSTAPIMGALIDKFDDAYPNTLVIGEGDSFIPGPWLVGGADPSLSANSLIKSTALARPDVAIMNAFGTDVSALGNHEFDLGSPVLQGAIAASGSWSGALFPLITTNLDFSKDSSLVSIADKTLGGNAANSFAGQESTAIKGKIAPYTVITQGGQKIGVVGATTFELLVKSSPNGTIVKGDSSTLSEAQRLAIVAGYLQPAIDALIASGVNKVVMVDQLDVLDRNKALAPLLTGVDVMVAGGSHERMGDATDTAVGFNGHSADFIADKYPIITKGKDGKPTLIVTTDTEYTYLGRLVVDFNAAGELLTENLSTAINGAYASTEANLKAAYASTQTAAEIIASSTIGSQVNAITTAINNVISSKDGNIFGYTNVYLEGDRAFGRAQEVNLGNISADANIYAALKGLGSNAILGSLKNGGGLRASIGSVSADGTKTAPTATTVKPGGAISQLDVENALRFDNKLMVFDSTPQQLLNILDFAAGLSAGNGGYAQIGGIYFSFDPTKAAGSRVQDVAVYDNGSNFRYILSDGSLSQPIDPSLDFTAAALLPSNVIGEQAALQNYLKATYPSKEKAFNNADTPATLDQRIQNLSVKSADTIFPTDLTNNRYLDPITGLHHFTSDTKEASSLINKGWKLEGLAWNLIPSAGGESGGLIEVHRLYNPNNKDHLLTLNDAEVTSAQKQGYLYEGVAGRALSIPSSGSSGFTVVQRFLKPSSGEHFYTASSAEAATLPGLGFVSEGPAWMY